MTARHACGQHVRQHGLGVLACTVGPRIAWVSTCLADMLAHRRNAPARVRPTNPHQASLRQTLRPREQIRTRGGGPAPAPAQGRLLGRPLPKPPLLPAWLPPCCETDRARRGSRTCGHCWQKVSRRQVGDTGVGNRPWGENPDGAVGPESQEGLWVGGTCIVGLLEQWPSATKSNALLAQRTARSLAPPAPRA